MAAKRDVVDAVTGAEASTLLGISYPTRFNKERERRQLVYTPANGLSSYPEAFLRDDLDHASRRQKAEFDRAHHLVVIEWGGSKPPNGRWHYSARQCRDVATRGLAAVAAARRDWGLPMSRQARRGRAITGGPTSLEPNAGRLRGGLG